MIKFITIPLLFISFLGISQNTISGTVLDENEDPLSYANVILKNTTDKNIVKVEYTNDDGKFKISNIMKGEFELTINTMGYKDLTMPVSLKEGNEQLKLGKLKMEVVSNELKEVTVSASRPILEVRADKLVFNVEGSINAQGNDGLELLRKAPGVVIDNNDNISLSGKSGVRVMIDGKPSPLGGEDLTNFLKSMNSSDIDNIEIITNPSAKYEAEGNAGIINIRLKKDKRHGSNATFNLGYAQGNTSRFNAGVSSNFRNKLTNVFGSYSYSRSGSWWKMASQREFNGLTYDANSLFTGPRNAHSIKLGTDFFLNKKHTIGFLVNTNLNYTDGTYNSNNDIGTIGVAEIDSSLVSSTLSNAKRNSNTFNINYQYEIAKEKSLTFDIDYGMFRNDREEDQPNSYVSPSGEVLSVRDFYNESPTLIDIYTVKLDYEQPFLKGKLGLGIKSSLVNTDNTFDFYNVFGNQNELDIDRSSQFEYKENVNAAYFTYSRKFGKFGLSGGLRMEQTNTKGTLTSYQPENDPEPTSIQYLDFFPSGGISYQPNMNNSFSLNYSRRLDRPNYQNLNPFEYKTNELSFRKGNPFLRPQYANNLQFSHTFKFRYTTSLGYTRTKDLMSQITYVDGNALVLSSLNLTKQDNYSISFSAPITFTKWWSSYTSINGFHLRNSAQKNDEIENVDVKVTALSYYTQHTFSIPWKLKLELSSWGSSPSVWGGVFKTDANYSIDLGLQRKFLNDKLNVKLSVSDIFKTAGWSGTSTYADAIYDANGNWDSRRFRINLSYFLGNDKVKSRKRKTGLEDQKGRTGESSR